jgi:hypothetical protein
MRCNMMAKASSLASNATKASLDSSSATKAIASNVTCHVSDHVTLSHVICRVWVKGARAARSPLCRLLDLGEKSHKTSIA